jgi:hypothetical protein
LVKESKCTEILEDMMTLKNAKNMKEVVREEISVVPYKNFE